MKKIKIAEEIVLDALKNGPALASEVIYTGYCAGIGQRTLIEAKVNIGAESIKRNGQWFWALSNAVIKERRLRIPASAQKWADNNPGKAAAISEQMAKRTSSRAA